ncbi:LysM peptidoglycan-binding domain-containing M23 family metallopeptidase [Streptomyces sp. SCSIO 30461]|uniref:M23 family metallopeptidase n=1 Tax=Streptomyces sp. SCSIO 30461 TaxID=3118085 RepID=UPI0030CE5642
MPGRGKHRRPKTSPLARGFVAAGTGGAAIALPLIGAAGAAHATGQSAPTVTAERTAAIRQAAVPQAVAAPKSPKTYTVAPGDHLSKIAVEQRVRGGWQKLYADNREAVGENPSLIHPGLKLALGAPARAAAPAERPAQAPARPDRASRSADRTADAPKTAPTAPQIKSEAKAKGESAVKAKVEAAAAPEVPAPQDKASFYSAPVTGGVSTAYRTPGALWSSGYHTGLDFIASTGTSVKSVGPGSVVSAGWAGAYGNQVVIRHTDGTYAQYAHLSVLSVSAGQDVSGGQQIGLSGSTGNSTGPHLHFEIRTAPGYGSDIDPLAYLRKHGVRL